MPEQSKPPILPRRTRHELSQADAEIWGIQQTVFRLQAYHSDIASLDPDRHAHSQTARGLVFETINQLKYWFLDKEIMPLLLGSLRYHDYRDMDLDLLFASHKPVSYDDVNRVSDAIQNAVEPRWPVSHGPLRRTFVDASVFSLARMKEFITNQITQQGFGASYQYEDCAKVLTGELLIPGMRPLHEKMITEIYHIARYLPDMRHEIKSNLFSVTERRAYRRLLY